MNSNNDDNSNSQNNKKMKKKKLSKNGLATQNSIKHFEDKKENPEHNVDCWGSNMISGHTLYRFCLFLFCFFEPNDFSFVIRFLFLACQSNCSTACLASLLWLLLSQFLLITAYKNLFHTAQ